MSSSSAMRAFDTPRTSLPAAPRTPEETGLSFHFLIELVAKMLYVRGRLKLADLVSQTALLPGVLIPVLDFMRAEKLCEMHLRGDTDGTSHYTLTELGRARAADFMRRSLYVGVTPVSLEQYVRQIESQSVADMGVTRECLHRVFSGIVLKEALLDQFGAAMNSGRAIFVYGPPGSGKTFIAERLVDLLSGDIAVPHAIEVNGEVVQLFDPLVHMPTAPVGAGGLDRGEPHDGRWVRCRRPVVMSGAELTLDMVDLEFDHQTRFYHAPQQLKANNGLFIIDDLGRQLVSAQALMNRWIVPLDRRIDYLTLHTGQKFKVPFDVIVVFSSNLRPTELADEAFLRRLAYKIFVGPQEVNEYRAILQQECQRLRMPYDEAGLDWLCRRYEAESRPLLACHPRDLLGQICDYARFHGVMPRVSPELIEWAWGNYFARE